MSPLEDRRAREAAGRRDSDEEAVGVLPLPMERVVAVTLLTSRTVASSVTVLMEDVLG